MTKLFCWHCGREIGQSDTVCQSCGTALMEAGPATRYFDVVGGRAAQLGLPLSPRTMLPIAALPKKGNFFGRFWRGEVPLDVSFWIVTIVGNLAILALPTAALSGLIAVFPALGGDHQRIVTIFIWITIVPVPIGVWQIIGAWRAANQWSKYSPRPGWSVAARIFLVVFAVYLALLLAVALLGLPQTRALDPPF